MTNIPYIIVNFGNQFKKKYCILYCWHRNGVVFSTLSKHALYILPISWWLDISTCFRFSSKSSADQAGEKPCDLSATRDSPQARFDATTGTDAARLPGDFTSWTPWIGQASKTGDFYNHKSHVIPPCTISATACRPGQSNQKKHALIPSTLLTSSLLSRCRSSLKQLQTDGTAKQCSFCGPWGLDNWFHWNVGLLQNKTRNSLFVHWQRQSMIK